MEICEKFHIFLMNMLFFYKNIINISVIVFVTFDQKLKTYRLIWSLGDRTNLLGVIGLGVSRKRES